MFIKPRANIFERMRSLQEAEADDAATVMNTGVDQTTTNADPNANNDAGEAESANDNDLDVNANIGDDDANTGGDDNGGGNDDFNLDIGDTGDSSSDSGDSSTTSSSDNSNPDEEVKKGNTDLFASLTAEEQAIKIVELKRLYNEMYTSVTDLIDRMTNGNLIENIDPRIITRLTSQIEELRRMLQDYIINSFPIKTYYENDVNYSIFLSMFTTIRGVFDEIYKDRERNQDKK